MNEKNDTEQQQKIINSITKDINVPKNKRIKKLIITRILEI